MPYSSDLSLHDTADTTLYGYLYNDLSPTHKAVFEHTTGYNNKKILSNSQMKRQLKLTQGQLSYAKSQIKDLVKGVHARQ